MNIQTLTVILIIAAAAVLAIRAGRRSGGCHGSCGSCTGCSLAGKCDAAKKGNPDHDRCGMNDAHRPEQDCRRRPVR